MRGFQSVKLSGMTHIQYWLAESTLCRLPVPQLTEVSYSLVGVNCGLCKSRYEQHRLRVEKREAYLATLNPDQLQAYLLAEHLSLPDRVRKLIKETRQARKRTHALVEKSKVIRRAIGQNRRKRSD
jgi:hypothetical protein